MSTSLDREVERRLKEREVRYTAGRRQLVRTLTTSQGPMSAAELHARVGDDVPLSSLYRSLSTLEETGVLVPHHGKKGVTRYELAEWLTGHHHHLVCVQCGLVEDIDLPDEMESELDRLVTRLGKSAKFATEHHSLEIEGRCSRCR